MAGRSFGCDRREHGNVASTSALAAGGTTPRPLQARSSLLPVPFHEAVRLRECAQPVLVWQAVRAWEQCWAVHKTLTQSHLPPR